MKSLKAFLKAISQLLQIDQSSLEAEERRREEAYLAGASDIYELEARQRAWDRRLRTSFPA